MHYTSEDNRYQVDIAENGAIRVKHGDWLSKYSAAIYGNYWNIHQFARKDRRGKLVPVANPNLIHTGETIYHLPTFETYRKSKRVQIAKFTRGEVFTVPRRRVEEIVFDDDDDPEGIVGRRVGPMGEKEKKKFILEHLRGEYDLRGEHLEFANELADMLHASGESVEVLEIVAEYLPKGLVEVLPHALVGVLEGVSEYCPLIGALAFPVHGAIEWANALEFGQRIIGLRAVAYGTTAWAFDDPVPGPPSWIRANISPGSLQGTRQAHSSYERAAYADEEDTVQKTLKAWNDSCQAAYRSIGEEVEKKGGNADDLKSTFRLLAEDNKNNMVRALMTLISEKYLKQRSARDAFWNPDPNYPS